MILYSGGFSEVKRRQVESFQINKFPEPTPSPKLPKYTRVVSIFMEKRKAEWLGAMIRGKHFHLTSELDFLQTERKANNILSLFVRVYDPRRWMLFFLFSVRWNLLEKIPLLLLIHFYCPIFYSCRKRESETSSTHSHIHQYFEHILWIEFPLIWVKCPVVLC